MEVLEPYSVEAIELSINQFKTGQVQEHDARFAPSTAQLASHTRKWQEALDKKEEVENPPELSNGILEVDFGGGRINMRGRSVEEQERIFKAKGLPDDLKVGLPGSIQALLKND